MSVRFVLLFVINVCVTVVSRWPSTTTPSPAKIAAVSFFVPEAPLAPHRRPHVVRRWSAAFSSFIRIFKWVHWQLSHSAIHALVGNGWPDFCASGEGESF